MNSTSAEGRSKRKKRSTPAEGKLERRIHCYNSSQKILLVGEGDFSFSSCLARALRSANNIVATSYHNKKLQVQKHWNSVQHLAVLKSLGCLLVYEVDVYNMHHHPFLKGKKFDIIIYNFPHAGHYRNIHEIDLALIKMHRHLVGGYFKSARKMLNEGGEVHLRHRDDPPYDKWNVVLLAGKAGLKLKEKVGFQVSDYPGYNNIRGGDIRTNGPFPITCAFTFKFSRHLPMVGDDDHPKNLVHGLSKKDEVLGLEMKGISRIGVYDRLHHPKNLDHGLSKKDEVLGLEMKGISRIGEYDRLHHPKNLDHGLSKKDEVLGLEMKGISRIGVYDRLHHPKNLDHGLSKKDEVPGLEMKGISRIGVYDRLHHPKNLDHGLSKKDEVLGIEMKGIPRIGVCGRLHYLICTLLVMMIIQRILIMIFGD